MSMSGDEIFVAAWLVAVVALFMRYVHIDCEG